MPINRPYRRILRPDVDGKYSEMITYHEKYAKSPTHFIRAFLLLLEDLKELFEYIEPADKNLKCYSFRTHSLLFRACVEIDANCRAILRENGYSKNGNLGIKDYYKINYSHKLSEYEVKLPRWTGNSNIWKPFISWSSSKKLPWYQKAYNSTKHNRHEDFENASFEHMIDAVCGVLVLLSAQFYNNSFSPGPNLLAFSGGPLSDGMESSIGEYFRIKFPTKWPEDMRYEFDWNKIKDESDPFQEFDYSKV